MIYIGLIAIIVWWGWRVFSRSIARADQFLDGEPLPERPNRQDRRAINLMPFAKSLRDGGKKRAAITKKSRNEPRYLQFEYADKYGRTKIRQIRNWTEDRYHVEGYDLDVMDYRTFSKDKIVSVLNDAPVIPKGLNRKYSFIPSGNERVALVGRSVPAPVKRYGSVLQGPVMEPLCFEYRYRDGSHGLHSLRDWYEYEKHISGWCTEYDESRTFAKKQVVEWFGDAESRLS